MWMNWLDRMNAAVDYMEENIDSEIDYHEIAKKACSSLYQFQRIFSFVVNISMSEYIRRRRMTLAAFELQNSEVKVIDIAIKYGYDSPEAFARAFQVMHGVSPTMARISGTKLKAYPRITFQISIKGDIELNYRIVKGRNFIIQGIDHIFDLENEEECSQEIPKVWDDLCVSGELEKMISLADIECQKGSAYPILACSSMIGDGSKFRYTIGIASNNGNEGLRDYNTIEVKGVDLWAVFTTEAYTTKGDIGLAIKKINNKIYTEWLPTSKYDHGNYQQETYYMNENGETYCEIWLAVTEK